MGGSGCVGGGGGGGGGSMCARWGVCYRIQKSDIIHKNINHMRFLSFQLTIHFYFICCSGSGHQMNQDRRDGQLRIPTRCTF